MADFGLAKALEEEQFSRTGDILGTPAYLAPEQLQGQIDRRSDIYSLGLTLYELLTLQPAHRASNRAMLLKRIITEEPPRPRKIRPEIPRDLETIVLKAIAHEPERRYASSEDLAADLRCFLEDRPIRARRIMAAERFWRWCRRNPIVAALSGITAVLLLLVALVASVGYARERTQRQRAEDATDVAVRVLDRIYERFAPDPYATGDRTTIKPVVSEGSAAVLEDLRVFYDRLTEQGSNDAVYLEKIALANRRLGDIRHRLGQLDQEKAAYQHALDLYEQRDRSSSGNPHFFEIGTIHTELGIVVHRLGQFDEATESWETAIQILQKGIDKGIANPALPRAMARARGFLIGRDDAFSLPAEDPPRAGGQPRERPEERFGSPTPGPRRFEGGPPGPPPPPLWGLPPKPRPSKNPPSVLGVP